MSRLAQIADTDLDALLYEIRTATKIYDKRDFNKRVVGKAEQKMLKITQAVAVKEREELEAEDLYTLPADLTIEQHLFNLTFCDKERPIKVIDHAFRQYDPEYGYWAAIPDEELEQRVLLNAELSHYPPNKNGAAKSLATAANVDKAMKYAGKKLFASTRQTNSKHLIAFRNFTVCTKTGDVREHNPDYHITTCLPYDYTPNSDCPAPMLRYIASSFGDDQVEYVRAALGLILDLTAPDRFIHLTGSSGSGKGVFTRLIMKFFGSESVGSPNNFKIFANPDQVHQYLSGKRLLAIDDIVGFIGEEIGRFYTAVERTAMNARCLFKPKGYTQQFDCRYTVASVGQLSAKYSNSKGWERRVFPLPTVRSARQEEDERLEVDLELCIADIISWALGQDKALRNDILRHPSKYNPSAAEYFRDAAFSSSSAWAFIEECLEPVKPNTYDTANDQGIDESKMYLAYKSYCAAIGRQPMGLDALKHELRQVLPLNWVDRRKGGKQPRRFVYMELLPAFEFGEFGATCNLNALGYDGVTKFREWATQYGHMHPYDSTNLQPVVEPCAACAGVAPQVSSAETLCDSEKIKPHTPLKNSNEGMPPLHTLHSDEKTEDQGVINTPAQPTASASDGYPAINKVSGAWVTPGKPEWWQGFEQRLIDAANLEQLKEAKAKLSTTRRIEVMNQWEIDGRYEWLESKAARLRAEAESSEQGGLL